MSIYGETPELHVVLKCDCEVEWQSDWSIDYYAEVHDQEDRPMPCPLRPSFYLDDAQGDWIIGGTSEAVSLMSSLFEALTVIASWREGAAL